MISKIQSHHHQKMAYVYLRQSTMGQVRHHQESTARQYALRDRALNLGWQSDQIRVLANALWMADVMDGPTLRVGGRVVHTFLFALLDDCSRLVPHGQYYDNEKLGPLLDCLKEAFRRRGLPEKLYTDQGKIFTCAHLQVVCANLKIKLLHARPYAAWSKGKIERFFQTVQGDFQERLRLEPVHNLESLNARFWHWLESEYHRRSHRALGGQSPADRFIQKATALRQLPSDTDWRQGFF